MEDEVSTLKENSSELTEITNSTKEEAKRLYKLAKGENADDNIISLLDKADLKTSASFVKQYQKEVDEKFEQSCSNCGSKDITRGSSLHTKEGLILDKDKDGDKNKNQKSATEVRNTLKSKKKKDSIILKNNK